jgi:cyanophycinase
MNDKTTRLIFVKLAVGITVLYISIVFGCSHMDSRLGLYHENKAEYEYASFFRLAGNVKGKLVLVGGGGVSAEIRKRTLELAGGGKAKVLVIPQAQQRADGGRAKANTWKKVGAGEVTILDLSDPKKAVAAVMRADLIWMPGGSKRRLMNILKNTGVPEAIRRRHREGAVVGGTSAGAGIMSKFMLSDDGINEGLGLCPEAIVATHFLPRRRFNSLLEAVLDRPGLIGVGIDERTAVFLHGKSFEVIGDSSVLIIDARKAKIENGAATDVVLHVLRSVRPTIETISPAKDYFDPGESVLLEAKATAYGGSKVRTVEFIVDGNTIASDTDAPYVFNWIGTVKGRHSIKAKIYDSKGRTKESFPVTIFVGMRALERSVTGSTDDAEEFADGSMYISSSDLDLIRDDYQRGDQVVGMRFTDILIPQGTQIKKAYLQFTVNRMNTEPTDLTIHAELAADAETFTEVRRNISLRKVTKGSVKWSPKPWSVYGERSERQRTPDLSSLIKEVVAKSDWQEGNALVFIITGSGERGAVSYDGDQQNVPLLHIEY